MQSLEAGGGTGELDLTYTYLHDRSDINRSSMKKEGCTSDTQRLTKRNTFEETYDASIINNDKRKKRYKLTTRYKN